MTSSATVHTMRALTIEVEACEVVTALRRNDVEPLLLKGPSIARWLYADDDLRSIGDIDLLVHPADRSKAEAALKALGMSSRYDGTSPAWAEEHADAWLSSRRTFAVDLHRHLWGVAVEPRDAWQVLWADHAVLSLTGTPSVDVAVPSLPARMLLIALHAAHHGAPGCKAVEDLRRACETQDEELWRRAVDLGGRLECLGAMAVGLMLHESGERVRRRLLPDVVAQMERSVPTMWSAPPTAEGLLRFLETPGLKDKARLLGREALPSVEFMRTRTPEATFARRGRRGVAAAYALRFARLIGSLLQGAPAAYRLRRRTERGRRLG